MKRKMRMILSGNRVNEKLVSKPVTIYDCSIEDLAQRVKDALTFQSALSAANYLGVPDYTVYGAFTPKAIRDKKRIFSPKLNRFVAIRLAKNTI